MCIHNAITQAWPPVLLAKFGLTPVSASLLGAPLIDECYANLECRVADTRLKNRYIFFVLEVVAAWIDPACKEPRTIHHRGHGNFAVTGEPFKLPVEDEVGRPAARRPFRRDRLGDHIPRRVLLQSDLRTPAPIQPTGAPRTNTTAPSSLPSFDVTHAPAAASTRPRGFQRETGSRHRDGFGLGVGDRRPEHLLE